MFSLSDGAEGKHGTVIYTSVRERSRVLGTIQVLRVFVCPPSSSLAHGSCLNRRRHCDAASKAGERPSPVTMIFSEGRECSLIVYKIGEDGLALRLHTRK